MKKIILLLVVIILFAALLGYWFVLNSKPLSKKELFSDFLIVKGSGASQIGKSLEDKGFIKSALTFKIYVRLTGSSAKIQAGEYRLSPSMTLFEIVSELKEGPAEIWITIPEGLRREEIADKYAKALKKDDKFVSDFLASSAQSEGYLFPDTYLFPKDVTAQAIVNRMKSVFENKTKDLAPNRNQVILASIIERETKTDEERPVVAGILNNRLEIGMALQVDASLQYAKGDWGPVTTFDKEIDSPYNTYKFNRLPPGPISNPGLSSIRAAVNPEQTDYFYYLHDSSGQIHYAKTLSEHNENISNYLTR